MNLMLDTEEPSYTLKTLWALYYGATYGGVTSHGVVHLTWRDNTDYVCAGNVLSIGPSGAFVRSDDGTLHCEVKPAQVLHAKVV